MGLGLMGGAAQVQTQAKPALGFFITSAGKGNSTNLAGLSQAPTRTASRWAQRRGRQSRVAGLSECRRRQRPAGRQREGPHRRRPLVRREGRDGARRTSPTCTATATSSVRDSSLTEKGDTVKGRGDTPNQHDILTGWNLDGALAAAGRRRHHVSSWTSNAEGSALIGRSIARAAAPTRPRGTRRIPRTGCSQQNLIATGGNGYFYCFAAK